MDDLDDLFARDQNLSILSETAGTAFVARWFKGPKQILQRTACIDGGRGGIRDVTVFGHRRASSNPGAG